MPRLVSLQTIRERARWYSDTENDTLRVTDSALNSLINQGIAELHDKLIASWGDAHTTKTAAFATVVNQSHYNLAADFYKMAGVQAKRDGIWYRLTPFQPTERAKFWNAIDQKARIPLQYSLTFDSTDRTIQQIELQPTPWAIENVIYTYYMTPPELAADADELDGFAGFEEYVALWAAIRCMMRDEQDSSALQSLFAQQSARIDTMRPRDVAEVRTVVDSRFDLDGRIWPWGF